MKKLLLTLGAVASVAAPVAAVVACSNDKLSFADQQKADVEAVNKLAASHGGANSPEVAVVLQKLAAAKTLAELADIMKEVNSPANGGDSSTGQPSVVTGKAGATTGSKAPAGGTVVEHAFAGHATYANIAAEDLDGAFSSYDKDLFNPLGNEGKTLSEMLSAIKEFNGENNGIVAGFSAVKSGDVIDQLAGKKLRAELYYQQDNKGAATYIAAASDVPAGAVYKLDTKETGHRINGVGNFGIMFVAA